MHGINPARAPHLPLPALGTIPYLHSNIGIYKEPKQTCAKGLPMSRFLLAAVAALMPLSLSAEPLAPRTVTEWKSVYGRIETKDKIPARARIGGTLMSLNVVEGDKVEAGQVIGRIIDQKISLQLESIAAQEASVKAQLENAETELKRGEDLLAKGVITVQRLDGLRTQVDVLKGQLNAVEAQRQVIIQQAAEGDILAPIAGRVLDVPASVGAVLMPGEMLALVGGGGTYLRLAIPERHARHLEEGAELSIEGPEGAATGKLARIYPQIENGRVIADVEVEALSDRFIDARTLVRVPVGSRKALLVPTKAVKTVQGLDFVPTKSGLRAVVLGEEMALDGVEMVEILTGLVAGDEITEHAE